MSGRGDDRPLGYLLHRVAAALRSEVTATALEPIGLTFPQYICMRVLAASPGRTNASLARDVNVSPQAMNTVVRSLQERGLVSRPATVTAGRSLPAELTRAGRDALAEIDAGVRAAEQKVLADLTAEQRREFRRLLVAVASD
ncbi:MarR family winged helix-turn-helix transcriptional regulator [Mycobacterium sp. WMMD1722]|uniref:MarR family winged helix-turn-helix transcriptional regulator n=1 Tax=Mycobacterium sp. WMMD1722 TaxID=3404117 RepID=UPI003BF4EC24